LEIDVKKETLQNRMNGTYKSHTDEYLRKILDFFIWEDTAGKIGLKELKRADKESESYSIMTKKNIKTKYFCILENNIINYFYIFI
jgi:hypothetical protein